MVFIDVIECPLVQVGGRTYRVQGSARGTPDRPEDEDDGAYAPQPSAQRNHPPASTSGRHGEGRERRPAPPARHVDEGDEDGAGDELIDESLIAQEGNAFVARLSCDQEVFPFVIGKEGKTKKRLEQETGATLTIPRRDATGPGRNEIVIRAATKQAVSSAYVRTELVISNALGGRLLDYTHFVSLPLASPSACRQFEAFRQAVLEDAGAASTSGLDESIFVKPQQLHLTLVMLKLYSDERRHKAKQALESLRKPLEQLLGHAPLKLHLQGLEYMNDDPSSMHVLYLKVSEVGLSASATSSRLERLCDLVVETFGAAGLLLPQDDRKVKLHATLINTRYRKRAPGAAPPGTGRGGGGGEQRQPFDGRALLDDYRQLDLGIEPLQALHLSQRGAFDDNGYYHCAAKLDLPK